MRINGIDIHHKKQTSNKDGQWVTWLGTMPKKGITSILCTRLELACLRIYRTTQITVTINIKVNLTPFDRVDIGVCAFYFVFIRRQFGTIKFL